MVNATKSRKSVKPVRTIRLSVPATVDNPVSIVTIAVGKEQDDYLVRPIPSDFGTAFAVEKIADPEGKSYAVNLTGNSGSCECKGFLRWGHCKHSDGLMALRRAGQL